MKTNRVLTTSLALVLSLSGAGGAARADEGRCNIDWRKLQLSPQQNQQIMTLESQWNQEYMMLQPSIIEDGRRLTQLLSDPKSDPLEILALQQSIARKKEHLRSIATANYLRKRQVLNEDQQHTLEDMIRQAVAERQKAISPGSQTEVMPDRIQMLMQRARNIWPR